MDLDFGSIKQTRRLPIYLLVDTSASMAGEPIQLVSQVIDSLHRELMEDPETIEHVWLSVITFGAMPRQIVPLTYLAEFVLPELSPGGPSKLGTAFRVLKEALDSETIPNQPGQKGDYQALIFLLVGSNPGDGWEDQANALRLSQQISSFVALYCNEKISVDYLEQITTAVQTVKAFDPKRAVRQFIRFASLPVFVAGQTQASKAINRSQMKEVSTSMTVAPFGKVNYWDLPDNTGRMVRATILTDFIKEKAKFGLAIDGSHSMKAHFESGYLKQVAQKLGRFFAHRDWHGTVSLIHWGTGAGHEGVQDLGDFSEAFVFPPPRRYGDKTRLLPALKYFTDGIQRPDLYYADWGLFVFLTDGAIEDLAAVKAYCMQLAKDLSEGKRLGMIKLLLLSLGNRVDSGQFEALDNLETGTNIDLWDTKTVIEIRDLDHPYELFAEIVDPDYILAPGDGMVRDNFGNMVADFREPGLPSVLEFILPFGEPAFSLEVAGALVHQPLPFAARGFDQASLLNIFPLDIDFGFVENLDQVQSHPILIHNRGAGIWPGAAESNATWLKVSPARFECPPNASVELHADLKPGAEAHLGLKSNMGLITIRGAGYEQVIRVTVAIRSRFRVLTTAEDRVIDM